MAFFSICIPNYNYSNFIKSTITSIINQKFKDVEICVADNASTDDSVKVVKKLQQKYNFIKLRINSCNVGLYENLKRASNMATSPWMILLSSDDIANKDALKAYYEIIKNIKNPEESILCSLADCIDKDSNIINSNKINKFLYKESTIDKKLSKLLQMNVYKIDSDLLLKNSLISFRNPLHFATTAYSKKLHDKIEGYSWGGIMGPDKAFVYNLLSVSKKVYLLDKPLFGYRMHESNNLSSQSNERSLKYLVDSYVLTINLNKSVLNFAKISREKFIDSFIKNPIALRVLQKLSFFELIYAFRILLFGLSCYPKKCIKSPSYIFSLILFIVFPFSCIILYLFRKFIYKNPNHIKNIYVKV